MEHTKPTRSRKPRLSNIAFELPISGRSFMVTATPFNVPSGEVFYRISYNNGPVHVFGWDESRNRFAETQKPAHIIPPVIEMGIAARLNDYISEMQEAA
ncbi:MAG: hypothetical protein ABI813_12265 [Bacteroidota bacterium]